MELRDGSSTTDRRLDRLVKFDQRSRNFPVMAAVKPKLKPRSYTWRCLQTLDQGTEGACVGFGVSHELIARPKEVEWIDNEFARRLYFAAQKIDEWPGGAYPGARPRYEGTSVLAGLKMAVTNGYAESYLWAFGIEDLKIGVGYFGPAVLGLKWMNGMFTPDKKGFIHATGDGQGGHCILCRAVNVKKEFFTLRNSWGADWGVGGDCYISFADMEKLLKDDGEAAFLVKRKLKGQ